MRFYTTLPTCSIAALLLTTASAADVNDITGDITWPSQWTVFAPVEEVEELAEPTQLNEVPAVLKLINRSGGSADERSVVGRTLEVKPGTVVDLIDFFERQSPRNGAYIFLEFESPRTQTVTLGFGADWWFEAWVNGQQVIERMDAHGNVVWPVSMTNHTVDVPVRTGVNTLAVRYLTGSASSTLALGGPAEYAPALRRLECEQARDLNVFQENFEDRLIFPVDVQATTMAERDIILPEADADLTAGELVGIQAMPERQIVGRKDYINPRFDEPVHILLGKERVPWEDRHLDVIVWLTPEDEDAAVEGEIEVLLKTADGEVLSRNRIEELSPSGLFFSVGLPEELEGASAELEIVWSIAGSEAGRDSAKFSVEPGSGVATSGRIPLTIPNDSGAIIEGAPLTLGVPFPRGALANSERVRMVDAKGRELPLQVKETARWSRFGPVKWLLCNFTVDLDGESRELFLDYGPDVERTAPPPIVVETSDGGFPTINAGRLRVDENGVAYDFADEGRFTPLLAADALTGAFVQHEKRGLFHTPRDVAHSIEEIGSEKVMVRRTGWYVDPASEERFCQFVTRLVFFRDSPVIRIFHTWIYTGDSNRDRIADMGWQFKTAETARNGEILTAFDGGHWLNQPSLVQFDYQNYLLPSDGSEHRGRTPGVATMEVGSGRVTFGVKDFWQNFPAELAFEPDGFTFYNWPRRNPAARFERPVPVDKAFLLRFAHEGEVLDFRMPDEYAEHDIWASVTRGEGQGPEHQGMHYLEGRPDMVNAQGVARTEEMFLYLTPRETDPATAAKVMQGFNDETLRAIVAPAWMTGSGVFGPVHPRDRERFPEEERLYDLAAAAPPKWVERLGTYGKWVYGDYPTWHLDLRNAKIDNYRATVLY